MRLTAVAQCIVAVSAWLLTGHLTFAAERGSADPRKKLVMLIAEDEYETPTTLPEFSAKHLGGEYRVVTVSGSYSGFDGIEEIADADVLLVSVRRVTPPPAQLAAIRRHVLSGKPVVGIRTASHAFVGARGQPLAAGRANWPEWDADVIGGNYSNHHGGGKLTTLTAADAGHVLLEGVALPFTSPGSLYKNTPLRAGAHPVLIGAIAGQPSEPVAWTFTHSGGGRTFYTSLGHPEDFQNTSFTSLLRNGIAWAASRPDTTESAWFLKARKSHR